MSNWQESKPAPSDIPNAELTSLITSNKAALSAAIGKHTFWTDSSTASIGVPRLSDTSTGPGSARAFYDVRSNISTPASPAKPYNGRLAVTSDTSRLLAYVKFVGGPTGPSLVPMGSKNVITYQPSFATIQNNVRVLVQMGSAATLAYATLSAGSILAVTFGTQYSVAPSVQVQPTTSAGTNLLAEAQITSITTSGFSLGIRSVFNPAGSSLVTCLWRSFGTVAL